jgi:hypothetical protein
MAAGAVLEHLIDRSGCLLVVHRHARALEKRPAVLGAPSAPAPRRLHARGDLDHALAARPIGPTSASSSDIGAMVDGMGTPP